MVVRSLLSAVVALAVISSADAADMYSAPGAAGYKDGPNIPGTTWTGFYVGINGGYGWSAEVPNISYYAIDPIDGPVLANLDRGFDADGGFGGAQLGYNLQRDRLVFGVEADFEASDIKARFTQIVGPSYPFERDTFLGKMDVNYFGTVRGRLGYTFGPALLYATGGFAYADIDQRQDSIPPADRLAQGAVPVFREKKGLRTGYVLGGGLEYAFNPSWSLKGEYQYLNFGSDTMDGVVPGAPVPLTTSEFGTSFHTVRVGLNYHFHESYEPLK